MTPRQFLTGMTVTFVGFFVVYILIMRFVLRLSASVIVAVMLPTALGTGIAASIGYRRWLLQYRAALPPGAIIQRPNPVLSTIQLLGLAAAAFCTAALLWSGHGTRARWSELFTAALAVWITISLLRNRS